MTPTRRRIRSVTRAVKSPYSANIFRNILSKGLLLGELRLVTAFVIPTDFAIVNGIAYLYAFATPFVAGAHWTVATRLWGKTSGEEEVASLLRRLEPQLTILNMIGAPIMFLLSILLFPQVKIGAVMVYIAALALANIINRQWLLLAQHRVGQVGRVQIAVALGRIAAVLLLGEGLDLNSYLILLGASQLALSCGFLWATRRYPWAGGALRWDRELIAPGLRIATANVFTAAYTGADLLMLTALFRDPNAGLYAAAYKIHNVVALLRLSLLELLFPQLTRLSPTEIRSWAPRLQLVGLVAASAIAVGGKAFAQPVTTLLLSEEYRLAADVLPLVLLIGAFMWANMGLSYSLVAMERDRLLIGVMAGASLVNSVLNLVLIPRYSIFGAAFATIVAEVLILLFSAWFISRTSFFIAMGTVFLVMMLFQLTPSLRLT